MKQNQPGSEPSPTDETDTTMTDAGEKNAGEVAPDDPDIQGVGDAGKPS